jgi:eukaryotic-like serine/threonine-protein kinase
VTNALYKKCVDAGKCAAPSQTAAASRNSYFGNSEYDNYPVLYVAWDDAKTFCEWAGKRLPTEAEWEKAARGDKGRLYPWGDEWFAARVNAEERIKDTSEVGSYPEDVSPYGVRDMGGNVREWIADWYDENYYANSPQKNPPGAPSGEFRVIRGGSWGSYKFSALAATRAYSEPETRETYVGIRCAASSV